MNAKPKVSRIQELVYELRVGDAAHRNLITAAPETPMRELRHMLRDHRISGIPIVERGRLAGIVSMEDFITWLSDGAPDCAVSERMTANVEVIHDDEPLIHAASRLETTGFGRLPVVDRHSGRMIGIVTKGDIIECLLHKLEIDYHEEEIHRYRASHIFEDILADKTTLIFESHVPPGDYDRAGRVSSEMKKTLTRLGIYPDFVRRAAIAAYEAEMNLVIHTDKGGDMRVEVEPGRILMRVTDAGPGIPDVVKARQPGFSTAPHWVRELGFGAGMGLPNIERCADTMDLTSVMGQGTSLEVTINTTREDRDEEGKADA